MATMHWELSKAGLWPEYRRAFHEFSRKVREVQSLESRNPEPGDVLRAALEVERARMTYSQMRDALVQQFLPARKKKTTAV